MLYYFLIYKQNNTNQLKNQSPIEGRVAQKAVVYCVAPARQVGFQSKIKSIYGFR